MNETRVLVTKAKNNDVDAFEELVRIYQNKVYALCFSLSGNRDDAQDLAQDTFIRAHRALGSFRNEADFGTWLHRIAVNTWLNSRRKNNGRQMMSLDEPYQLGDNGAMQREVAAGDSDPQRSVEERELRNQIRTALYELTEEQRAVILLRDMEGYSYEEVSRMMGCSLGTVKSRISRAREAMRRKLTDLAHKDGVELPVGKESR